jgi:signal transduction histidine kinase
VDETLRIQAERSGGGPGRSWWPWSAAAIGVLAAAVDVWLLRRFGVELQIGGVDASAGVLVFLAANYAVLGYVLGRLAQGRARARHDAETIQRQLGELERAQRELVQQEKLAAIGRVSAGVAHEVRNPLGVIRASAAMVKEGFQQSDDAYRACDFICQEIDRLDALISALLTFSRPAELHRHTVSIEKVVERALALAGDELRQRGIALDRQDSPGVPELRADPDLVSQLIYDLLCNASEAVGEGGRIAVRTGCAAGGVCVEVADSGAGVAPELAAQLFEPFFTTKASGTGLGLAVVRRIVDGHGGEVTLGAGLGGGTVFTVRLPLRAPVESPGPLDRGSPS